MATAYDKTPQPGEPRGNDNNANSTSGTPRNGGKKPEYGVNNPLTEAAMEGMSPSELTHVLNGLFLRLNRLGARLLPVNELDRVMELPGRRLYCREYDNGLRLWFDLTDMNPVDLFRFEAELKAVCL